MGYRAGQGQPQGAGAEPVEGEELAGPVPGCGQGGTQGGKTTSPTAQTGIVELATLECCSLRNTTFLVANKLFDV